LRLEEDLLWFLEHPSVTGSEKELCDDLHYRIEQAGGWEVGRVSNNLVVWRSAPDPSRQKIVFAGHLDTVPEPEGGIRVRSEDGEIYGRGASDMKSGDAVMLALLESFDWKESCFEPLFVFYEREEGPHEENGLRQVFEQFPEITEADLALCLEPTANALELGCVGTAQVEVTFRGTPAHSARPWLGENAITAAGQFLAGLHKRSPEEVRIGDLTFHEVLTPTLARGGTATNVVPDEFLVNVNMRFAPGRGREHVEHTFEELLSGKNASFRVADFAPSGDVEPENPLVQELSRLCQRVRAKQAWTDVARFTEAGVAAANLGPGVSEQAHQRQEHTEISLLDECYGMLSRFLRNS
jgi:succinyl-diaminopimelate desuccinylase